MRRIEAQFRESFSYWRLELPREAVQNRQRGKIVEAGWTIWYLFGADERGEFLDYYSSHRMTSDSHVRLYDDGRVEGLESLWEMRQSSNDPDEEERLKAEFWEHNERVARLLEEKGFGLQGDEHGSAKMRRGELSSRESNQRLSRSAEDDAAD